MANLYIIAGCNGAGKTTASYTLLPEMLDCREFVNADAIAAGLSPFQPEKVAFEAGRLMLERIHHLINEGADFAFETTLATRSYVSLIQTAKEKGFEVLLVFFWLNSIDLAKARVAERVKNGGHKIPSEIIERRYLRGIKNLFELFMPVCDEWWLMDNSDNISSWIAEGKKDFVEIIYNSELWNVIKSAK